MTPGGSSGPGASRPPLALVVSITLTGIMGNVLIVPVLPDIAADLGVAPSRQGLLLAVATAPGILLAPLIGFLADRFGRRAVVVPCLVLFGVAGGAGGLAPNFGVLLALRLVQGAGSAGLINIAIVIITDHWHGADRARMIGRNAAALTASLVVFPPLGGLLAEVGGWRATFVPYWIGVVTAGAVLARLPGGPARPTEGLASQLRATAPVLRSRALLAPMVLACGVFVIIFAVLAAAPGYLDATFGLGASARGLLLGLPAVTSTGAALCLGRLSPRFGPRRLVVAGLLLFAVGLGLVGAAPALVVVGGGLLVYGLGEGLLIATLQDTAAGLAPPDRRGTVVATWVGFARAGQTAGPVLAGAGAGIAGIGARATFGAVASLAVVLAALAGRLRVTDRAAFAAPTTAVCRQ